MKTRFFLYSFFLLAVAFTSCSKDEKEVLKFTYDSNEYPLNYGALKGLGATDHSPKTYEFDLFLAGSGIKYDDNQSDFAGKGNFIDLNMYSAVSDFLKTGSYAFDGFESKDSLTFDYGTIGINYDLATETGDTLMHVKTGIAIVEKRGNVYKVTLNLFTFENKRIDAYFNGFLENIALSTP